MNKFRLSPEDLETIRTAAAEAESKTSGEIASAVITECSSYAFPELLVSLLGGVIYFLGALLAFRPLAEMVNGWFWEPRDWYVTAFYGLTTVLVTGILYVLVNIPGIDRLIVPARVREKKVHRRAMVHFLESGVYKTRDRTGILIFISLRERRVEIIADEGINALVPQESWDGILTELVDRIRKGEIVRGLVSAIGICGGILSRDFPKKTDDTNELPDGLVFLED